MSSGTLKTNQVYFTASFWVSSSLLQIDMGRDIGIGKSDGEVQGDGGGEPRLGVNHTMSLSSVNS